MRDVRARGIGDAVTCWRYLGCIWGAGATLLTVILLTTSHPRSDRAALLVICAVGFAGVAAMLVTSRRLPASLLQPTVLVSDVLIALVVYFSGEPSSFYAMYFIWLNVYVCYFFAPRVACLQSAAALAAYLLVLALMPGAIAITPWLMTAGTMALVGTMVSLLTGNVDRLVVELGDAARNDPLTGLLNRRGFDEAIAREIQRARRGERPLSLVIGDLDHFKRVNDRAGHSAGDEILRRLSALLRECTRAVDSTARIGGEEFAVLVPDTDAGGAHVLAERLRAAVGEAFAREPEPITMSFGIACFPDDANAASDLLQAADSALYTAKRRGRDRSVRYSPQLAATTDGELP